MRVMLVDDRAAVREGLRLLLGDEPDIEIVGEAEDGEAAARLVDELRPDVVLMDIEMPGGDGLRATRQIKARPNPPAVLVMGVYGDNLTRTLAHWVGADGFVEKSQSLVEVATALRAVFRPGKELPGPT